MNSETQETRTFYHNIPERRDKHTHITREKEIETRARDKRYHKLRYALFTGRISRVYDVSVCVNVSVHKAASLKCYTAACTRAVDTTATQYFQNSCLPNQTRIHTRYFILVSWFLFFVASLLFCVHIIVYISQTAPVFCCLSCEQKRKKTRIEFESSGFL